MPLLMEVMFFAHESMARDKDLSIRALPMASENDALVNALDGMVLH